MAMRAWIARVADNVFLRDQGPEPVGAGELAVQVNGAPDARLERYDATATTGRRAATALELQAQAAAEKDTSATRLGEDVVVAALARIVWEEIQKRQPRTGVTPLTWDEFKASVKALILSRL